MDTSVLETSDPVVEDVIVVMIDGVAVNLAPEPLSEAEQAKNKAHYNVTLKEGEVLSFTENGEPLYFYTWDQSLNGGAGGEVKGKATFTCRYAGTHDVWINAKGEVWVTEPAAPAGVIVVYINGFVSESTLVAQDHNPSDKAKYKGMLAAGQTVAFTEDGEDLYFYTWDQNLNDGQGGEVKGGKVYTAPVDGEYTFFINDKDQIWVTAPEVDPGEGGGEEQTGVIEVLVNGTPIDLAAEADPGDNKAIYKVPLEVDDVLSFTEDDEPLYFYTWDQSLNDGEGGAVKGASTFTCTIAGVHTVYVNTQNQLWISEPAAPAGAIEISVDNTPIDLAPEADPGDNKAVYVTNLTAGQVVTITEDDEDLHFYHYDTVEVDDGAAYEVAESGEYTFYINKDSHVYVGFKAEGLPEPVDTATYRIMIDGVAGGALTKGDNIMIENVVYEQWQILDVAIAQNAVVTFYDVKNDTEWHTSIALDQYSAGAWEKTENGFVCPVSGHYDIYLKLHFGMDNVYFGGHNS